MIEELVAKGTRKEMSMFISPGASVYRRFGRAARQGRAAGDAKVGTELVALVGRDWWILRESGWQMYVEVRL